MKNHSCFWVSKPTFNALGKHVINTVWVVLQNCWCSWPLWCSFIRFHNPFLVPFFIFLVFPKNIQKCIRGASQENIYIYILYILWLLWCSGCLGISTNVLTHTHTRRHKHEYSKYIYIIIQHWSRTKAIGNIGSINTLDFKVGCSTEKITTQ